MNGRAATVAHTNTVAVVLPLQRDPLILELGRILAAGEFGSSSSSSSSSGEGELPAAAAAAEDAAEHEGLGLQPRVGFAEPPAAAAVQPEAAPAQAPQVLKITPAQAERLQELLDPSLLTPVGSVEPVISHVRAPMLGLLATAAVAGLIVGLLAAVLVEQAQRKSSARNEHRSAK